MAIYRVNKPRHPHAKFHVKKNDEVVVLSGTQQGKRGKVLEVLRSTRSRVIIEGVNFIKKASRKTQDQPQGGIIEREGTLHISKVMLAADYDQRKSATKEGQAPEAEKPAKEDRKERSKPCPPPSPPKNPSRSPASTRSGLPRPAKEPRVQERHAGAEDPEGRGQLLHRFLRGHQGRTGRRLQRNPDDHRPDSRSRQSRPRASPISSCARARKSASRSRCAAPSCMSSSSA